jgi:phosphoglycolate phosphatase-like HAD superfamily hydrolase
MVKAVIFDIDGTLIDSVDAHAASWSEAFGHFGFSVEKSTLRQKIGMGADFLLRDFLDPETIARRGKDIESFRAELFKKKYLSGVQGFPGVRALFQHIRRRGQMLVLASSCKQEELDPYLEIADVADLVDVATTSDDAERSKPCPDIFQAALERISPIGADEAVVVGDSPFDAKAARNANIAAVGVLCGGFQEEQLRQAGCAAVYRDPADLLSKYDCSPLAREWKMMDA